MTTSVNPNLLDCQNCGCTFPPEYVNLGGPVGCPHCGVPFQVMLYPSLVRKDAAVLPEAVLIEGESTCFYHPAKKAVIPCDHCGRFLCGLCDVPMNGEHYCPQCIERGETTPGRVPPSREEYIRHDGIVLWLAVGGMILVWPSLFTAPAALYYVIRHRKSPLSAAPRKRWRMWAAAGLALLQIGLWVLVIAGILGASVDVLAHPGS